MIDKIDKILVFRNTEEARYIRQEELQTSTIQTSLDSKTESVGVTSVRSTPFDGQTTPETSPDSVKYFMTERSRTGLDRNPPPSLNFIFHNKIPKAGSSTMKHIFEELSTKNNFVRD